MHRAFAALALAAMAISWSKAAPATTVAKVPVSTVRQIRKSSQLAWGWRNVCDLKLELGPCGKLEIDLHCGLRASCGTRFEKLVRGHMDAQQIHMLRKKEGMSGRVEQTEESSELREQRDGAKGGREARTERSGGREKRGDQY